MLTDFQDSFIDRLSSKFLTNQYLNIPPHLTCIVSFSVHAVYDCNASSCVPLTVQIDFEIYCLQNRPEVVSNAADVRLCLYTRTY